MPNVAAAGTYTKDTPGWEFLAKSAAYRNDYMTLLFAGTMPTTIQVQYVDDVGTDRAIQDGDITALPATLSIPNFGRELKVVVTGTAAFNVSPG